MQRRILCSLYYTSTSKDG